MNEKTSTKQQIIESAVRVINDDGVGSLTLEAVAHCAGVSKGGLLYHFPNKDRLIAGMLAHYLSAFEADVDAAGAEDDSPHRWLKAFVRLTFHEQPPDLAIVASQLAAIANNPALLDPVRERYRIWFEKATADGLPPEVAHLVIAAADGYWYAALFGVYQLNAAQRDDLLGRLLGIIAGA